MKNNLIKLRMIFAVPRRVICSACIYQTRFRFNFTFPGQIHYKLHQLHLLLGQYGRFTMRIDSNGQICLGSDLVETFSTDVVVVRYSPSIISAVLFSLSITMMSGLLCCSAGSVWTETRYKILGFVMLLMVIFLLNVSCGNGLFLNI